MPFQSQALIQWYQKERRTFPWRENPNPYWVWIAEIMSQQTQMGALLPYFNRFLERFSDVDSLARAETDEVIAQWAGLGYYSRARNIHRTAKILAKTGFPRSATEWLELPGIGPYTAAAIASQCFEEPTPVWDGNVLRVMSRLLREPQPHTLEFRKTSLKLLSVSMMGCSPSQFNQALMELGALICTPRNPKCNRCPIQKTCTAFQTATTADFPPPKPRTEPVSLSVRTLLLLRNRDGSPEILVAKRPAHLWYADLWDFPTELGGRKTPVLNPPPFLVKPTLGGVEIGSFRHSITHHRIQISVWVCESPSFDESGQTWIPLEELLSSNPPVPFSTTGAKALRLFCRWRAQKPMLAFSHEPTL